MKEILFYLSTSEITFMSALLRLTFSFIACGFIGLEREIHKQTAGWRTHIIIGLGATLLMLLSAWLPQSFGLDTSDPARIAAQVVSGIGFLGAGAFLKIGNNVKGLTTASTIWFSAGLGLTIGAGMWEISLIALSLALITLVILEFLERKWFPQERLKVLQVWCKGDLPDIQHLQKIFNKYRITIQTVDASKSRSETSNAKMKLLIKISVNVNIKQLFNDLYKDSNIIKIRLQENI
ncbi:MAG TPA: MgtC/SapB family protein [Spirochaetia bacterium]|nr:MgtC/SapB family protein [Spirochaetales bacterium]HPD80953.1 MgtC/SapB family protein [Spirochaetales bacterium]HQK34818.1 MgtC/SapB family protein [Spirochaetales bacterium]HRS65568.1 MgtC/SapB family protein [Spirochaetia bacterium]HRV29079.1 MgtC/SapB family protein [Spirochaetia bacterium]